jgi:tetratricopeptide (TPR) repeat protein
MSRLSRPVSVLVLAFVLVGAGRALGASPSGALAGGQPDSARHHFRAGVSAYEQGRHEDALAAFQRAEASGYVSGALFYNLGNAYYRTDQIGQTIRYYEKARRLLPDDPRLDHNVQRALERVRGGAPPRTTPEPGLAWLQALGPHRALAAAWGLVVIGLVLGVYRAWGDEPPAAWLRPAAIGLVATGIMAAGLVLAGTYAQAQERRVVVVAETVPVRAAPQPAAAVDTTAYEGYVLHRRDQQRRWVRVAFPNGRTGWVPSPAVADI